MCRAVYVLLKATARADEGRGATTYQIAAHSGYDSHTVYSFYAEMRAQGLIVRVMHGRYRVTEKGKLAVALTDGMQSRAVARGLRFKFGMTVDWFQKRGEEV
jgi:DNA-binding IclR family transcriptional regulator